MTAKMEVSYGELLDKIPILEIKLDHATDPGQRGNIATELGLLSCARDDALTLPADAAALVDRLKEVNRRLWDIKDDIRDCDRHGDFGPAFVELARSVYRSNDERAALKRELNDRLGSPLVEEKLYRAY